MEQIAQQMAAALQSMQQQNAQFNRALDLLQDQQRRQQETLAAMTAGTGASGSGGIGRGVVDVKQVGKPDFEVPRMLPFEQKFKQTERNSGGN